MLSQRQVRGLLMIIPLIKWTQRANSFPSAVFHRFSHINIIDKIDNNFNLLQLKFGSFYALTCVSKFPMMDFFHCIFSLGELKSGKCEKFSQIHAQIFVLKILFQKLDKCFLVYKQNKVKHSLHSQNKLWRISIKNHFHVLEMPNKLNLDYFNNLMYSFFHERVDLNQDRFWEVSF